MKKCILIVSALVAGFALLNAQIEKGSTLIGGNAGFQFKSNPQQNEFLFSVSPYALYSVIKHLAIGGQLFYSYDLIKQKAPTNRNSAGNTFGIGPALRGNIFLGGKTYLFIHGASSFGISNRDRDPTNASRMYYYSPLIGWRCGPGLVFFATRNMAVEIGAYYDGMKEVWSIKQKKEVILAGAPVLTNGLTIAVGLQFYVHKKKKVNTSAP